MNTNTKNSITQETKEVNIDSNNKGNENEKKIQAEIDSMTKEEIEKQKKFYEEQFLLYKTKEEKLNEELKETREEKKLVLQKRNSLMERNRAVKMTYEKLILKMDKFVYLRSFITFALLSYFLGNNIDIYLNMFLVITIYVIVLRMIRFWVKRYLMYLFEFCYWGNLLLCANIYYYDSNIDVFNTAFMFACGVMTLSAIIFWNRANFGSTDHLSSSWIHFFPMLTCWAIRWRNKIYFPQVLEHSKFNFPNFDDNLVFRFDFSLVKMIVLPLIFWAIWAVYYYIFFYTLCDSYIKNPKYKHGLQDAQDLWKMTGIVKAPNENVLVKYLLQHLGMFFLGLPFSFLCYYSFSFHTTFLIIVMTFLVWNASEKKVKSLEKKIKRKEAGKESDSESERSDS